MTANLSVNTVDPIHAAFRTRDILPQILRHLPGKEIARSSAVSSFFNGVVKEDLALRRIVMRSKIVKELTEQETKIPDKALANLVCAQADKVLSFVAVEEAKMDLDQAQNTIGQAIEFARTIQDAWGKAEALLFAAAMQVHVSGKDAARNTFRESLQALETIEEIKRRDYPQLIADWKSVSPEEVLDLIQNILALSVNFEDSYLSFYAATQAELGDCDAGLETAGKIQQINSRLPVLSQIVCLLQAKDKEKATAVYREMESHLRERLKFAEQFHRFCSCITGLYAMDRKKYANFTRRMKESITKSENPSTRSSYLATLGRNLRSVDAKYAAEVLNEARIHAMEIPVPAEKEKMLKSIAKYQSSVDPERAYETSFLITSTAKRMKVLAKIALKL